MKGTEGSTPSAMTHQSTPVSTYRAPARKRPTPVTHMPASTATTAGTKESEWIVETPKRKPPPKPEHREVHKYVLLELSPIILALK